MASGSLILFSAGAIMVGLAFMAHTAHAVAQFTISRDGSVKDIKIVQTSGNLSVDNSGLRALLASNPMPALPSDYGKSFVTVTFDFDLSMTR